MSEQVAVRWENDERTHPYQGLIVQNFRRFHGYWEFKLVAVEGAGRGKGTTYLLAERYLPTGLTNEAEARGVALELLKSTGDKKAAGENVRWAALPYPYSQELKKESPTIDDPATTITYDDAKEDSSYQHGNTEPPEAQEDDDFDPTV